MTYKPPSNAEILNSARRTLRRAYPDNVPAVEQGMRGLRAALDAKMIVRLQTTTYIDGALTWAFVLRTATNDRPDYVLTRVLKLNGYKRTTNHSWAFPYVRSEP